MDDRELHAWLKEINDKLNQILSLFEETENEETIKASER